MDAAFAAHAVEGFAEGFHHGVCQHLGLQLALAFHGVAVHLEGEVVIDLSVDPGEHVGSDAVVCCAVCDARHLVRLQGDGGLAAIVQVVQTHLEGSNLQQRATSRAGSLLLGQSTALY